MNSIWLNAVRASGAAAELWTPTSPTTEGASLPHTWKAPGVENFQDAAKTTPADEIGDVVGAAVNQGSDTYDIVQATTGKKPTLQEVTINSITSKVLRFDGVDDFLQGAFGGGAISPPFTVFAVVQLAATAVNDNSFHFAVDSNITVQRMILAQYAASTPDAWAIYGGSYLVGGDSDGNANIWTALFNGTSSKFWHNGANQVSGTSGTSNLAQGVTVGAAHTGATPWKGDIGEILIYPGNLSTADKNQVGEYLERVTGIVWTTIV